MTYRVVIQADVVTEAIRFSSCNCPFDGPICKHQVAVLFSIQMTDDEKPEKPNVSLDKVDDLLSKVTFEELKDYVKSYTNNDNDFKNHLLSSFAAKSFETVADFKGVVEQALRPLKRKHGFIPFQAFNNAIKPIESLVESASQCMMQNLLLQKYLPEGEWEKRSKAYKQKMEKHHEYPSLAEILKDENNPEGLLRVLTASNNIELIQEYDDSIPQELRPQLQNLYFSVITANLEARADRSNYRFNARLIKRMLGKFDDMLTIGFVNLLP